MRREDFRKTLLAVSISTVLSACGGGSGGDGTSFDATISGVASKGIIINGKVVADELNSDATVKNPNVGSDRTDSKGKYTLHLNNSYSGGPIKVTVTADSKTTMVCDATTGCGSRAANDIVKDPSGDTNIDFGEPYQPAKLQMAAMVPEAKNGAAMSVQVTPYTNMAAKRALSFKTLDASVVNNANSAVSKLFGGVDILRTEAIDITDTKSVDKASPAQVAYATLNAAVAEQAPSDINNGQPDIDRAINSMANDFEDGTFTATDTNNSSDVMALDEILAGVKAFLPTSGSTSVSTNGATNTVVSDNVATNAVVSVLINNIKSGADNGNEYVPQPSPNAGNSDVAKAKAFLADLRTWGGTLSGKYDVPVAAFQKQIDMAKMASNMLMKDGTSDAVALGVSAVMEYFNGNLSSLTAFSDQVGNSPFTAGTISQTGNDYIISGGQVKVNGDTVSLDMKVSLPADQSTLSQIPVSVSGITAEGTVSKLVVKNGTISITLAADYVVDYSKIKAGNGSSSLPSMARIDFDFVDVSTTQKITMGSASTMGSAGTIVTATDPVSFSGSLKASFFPYLDVNGQMIDALPGSIHAFGTVSNVAGSYDLDITASIPDAANVVAHPAQAPLASGSRYTDNNPGKQLVEWHYTNNGNTFVYNNNANGDVTTLTFTAAPVGSQFAEVNITMANQGYVYGSYKQSTTATSLQQFIPQAIAASGPSGLNFYGGYSAYVNGQGLYYPTASSGGYDYSRDGYISYTLGSASDVVFFDQNQPLKNAKLGVSFGVQLPNLPKAQISVSGNLTGLDQGDATLTINFDNRSLTFTGSRDSSGSAATMTVQNQDGVKLAVKDVSGASSTMNVTLDGVSVATVNKGFNGSIRVEYIDGTFDIF